MPAVNGALSADALARLYGALANGGEPAPLLSRGDRPRPRPRPGPHRRRRARPADALAARLPPGLRHRPEAPQAFGHYGYGGSGGWADPDLGLSLGFVTNRIGSVTTPMADLTLYRLSRVVRECALSVSSGSRTPGTA